MTATENASTNQFSILTKRSFLPLFLTQFLGAFNDNFFKNALIILIAFRSSAVLGLPPEQMVALAGGIFILPFFIFSALAGQLADKYDKARLTRFIKAAEVGIMALASFGFWFAQIEVLLFCLFLMGLHSTFFGPIKYAILPQHLQPKELIGGNAWVSAATFVAILLGTTLGGLLIAFGENGVHFVSIGMILISLLGLLTSFFIPAAPAAAPTLKVNLNPFPLTLQIIKLTKENRTVFNSILGISWFWFVGAGLLSIVPPYVKGVLQGQETLATFFLSLFTIGVAVGALLCGRISRGRIEIGLIPFGAFSISFFAILIGCLHPNLIDGQVDLFGASSLAIIFGFLFLSISSGFYFVPLIALIQEKTEKENRSRIIAGGNIINALFMVLASVFVLASFRFNISTPTIFIMIGVLNFAVAFYIFRLVPEFLYRFFVVILAKFFYKIKVTGLHHIPETGAAVLICNHISWVDWLIIYGNISRPLRPVVDYYIMQHPILGPLLRDGRAITIAAKHESEAAKEAAFLHIKRELDQGHVVLIFPEGKIASQEEMNPFKPGIERIIRETPVPVIPMAISGLWGSLFSRSTIKRSWLKRLRSPRRKVDLCIGPAIPPHEAKLPRLEEEVKKLKHPESLYG